MDILQHTQNQITVNEVVDFNFIKTEKNSSKLFTRLKMMATIFMGQQLDLFQL